MNISKLFVIFASILAVVMVAGFASAAVTLSVQAPELVYVGPNATVSVSNTGDIPATSVSFYYSSNWTYIYFLT